MPSGIRDAQAGLNRPWFESALAAALASVPEVEAVLGIRGARIADVGCGAGWSTIALARAYPSATVVGVDVDADLFCLPDGLSSTPSEGTGTVMRRAILTDYANRAGFTSVQVLPVEEFGFWRFYRLLR